MDLPALSLVDDKTAGSCDTSSEGEGVLGGLEKSQRSKGRL